MYCPHCTLHSRSNIVHAAQRTLHILLCSIYAIYNFTVHKTQCAPRGTSNKKNMFIISLQLTLLPFYHSSIQCQHTIVFFSDDIKVGQIFILRSNFGQNKDHMTCKQVRVPLKTDIQQVRGPSKLTSSKLGGPQIKGWPNLHASGSRWLPFPAQHILSSNIHFYLQQRTHHKDKKILEIIIFVLGQDVLDEAI